MPAHSPPAAGHGIATQGWGPPTYCTTFSFVGRRANISWMRVLDYATPARCRMWSAGEVHHELLGYGGGSVRRQARSCGSRPFAVTSRDDYNDCRSRTCARTSSFIGSYSKGYVVTDTYSRI